MLVPFRRHRLRPGGPPVPARSRPVRPVPVDPVPLGPAPLRTAEELAPRAQLQPRPAFAWVALRFVGRVVMAGVRILLVPPKLVRSVAPGVPPLEPWEHDARHGHDPRLGADHGGFERW